MKRQTRTSPPQDLSSRLRGLYRRVADRLGVHPSYVSRVARGERYSKLVADALKQDLNKIVETFRKQQLEAHRTQLKKKKTVKNPTG